MTKERKGMKETKEIRELKHEPLPGYRTGFYIAFSFGILYLGTIIFLSLK